MQSRGAIKFFAVLFALVCLYQLSFTFLTSRVESKAKDYAHSETSVNIAKELANGNELLEGYYIDSISKAREVYYLDSMANQVVYLWKYTYKDCKEREINLGLDLKGGMNVTLEVSIGSIVKGLSGNSQNPVFLQAMDLAYEKQKDGQKDFVTYFGEAIEEIDPNFSLASIFLYEFRDKGITANSTNSEVIDVIKTETDGAFDRTFNILRTRIDKFGVAQPNVQKIASSNRVLVELPGVKDPARVRKLLQGTAQLEFWETYRFSEINQYFAEANTKLADIYNIDETTEEESDEAPEGDSDVTGDDSAESTADTLAVTTEEGDTTELTLLDQLESDTTDLGLEDQQLEQYKKNNPLYTVLNPAYEQRQGQYYPSQSATVGYAAIKDTAKVNKMLRQTKSIFPRDLKFAWVSKPRVEGSDILELIALKVSNPREMKPALGGEVITNARQDYDQNGRVEVSMSMNSEGAKIWKRLTADAASDNNRQIAIVLDDYVYSVPTVNSEIPNGMSSISGGQMEVEEAQDLANILKAGKLPARARIVEEAVVGPSLGHEAVNAGLWSFVIAFSLVLIYMVFYYNRAGLVADIALLTNIFFLFGVLASFGAVLTLPGIAGIVLTLGMAVDANVIIFERVKEEIRAGKGLQLAITDGYKKAYSAIIDGNVTTLLTGIVLYIFGSGPVQGFATTLVIGILSSLFSAIFISRLIFTWSLKKNLGVNFANKFTINTLAKVNIDFLSMRKIGYVISGSIIVIGILSLAFRGLNYGVDFSGGRTYVIRFDQDVNTDDIRGALSNVFIDDDGQSVVPEVKTFGPNRQVKVTTKFMIDNNEIEVDSIIQSKIFQGLQPFYKNQDIVYKAFSTDTETEEKLVGILSSQKVGPTIADDIRNRAVMAIVFALIVIFIYIALRFRKWQYGLAGVVALFHDSMITIGLFSIFYNYLPFNMEIDQAFIAAILTIIGYSINDTVIIFDRIREFGLLYKKRDLKTNINAALNSTLARTINTSGTTTVVLLTIFIFGGEVIRGFTFALLIGILIGTYSSLFSASPIVYDLIRKKEQEVIPVTTKRKKKLR